MTASAPHPHLLHRAARLLAALALAVLVTGVCVLAPSPRMAGAASSVDAVLPALRSGVHLPYFSFARALRPRS